MFPHGCRGEPCCTAAAHPPSLLGRGTLWGVRTRSLGQQLLQLLSEVAVEVLGAFFFFFFFCYILLKL